jgi:signal transduction histidine kinase
MSSIISKPIQNIELVAREIANLNFAVEAHEYNNRENESLSKSINLISANLKETLGTINKKNEELTKLYEDQSNQIALKKQLVSSISHELKTPLMIMQVTIQGILDGIISENEVDKELMNIIEEINKSSIMIQDMLQIYRLDDANTQLDLSYFNLGESVCFYIKEFTKPLEKYKFEVSQNIDKEVFIEADQKLIKRVISNFITNAIKYTPVGEKIIINVSQDKNNAYFEITNYGISITESELKNVWLPFYRIEQEDAKRQKTKGSGVGLYLVSEILKAHKADYGMESKNNYVKVYFKIRKKQTI